MLGKVILGNETKYRNIYIKYEIFTLNMKFIYFTFVILLYNSILV